MKNEQVSILVLAYIIGFTTAYIAFGIADNKPASVDASHSYTEAHYSNDTNNDSSKNNTSAIVKPDGLYALLGERERILSAQAISATVANNGFHHDIVLTVVSTDGKYIYYCAQLTPNDKECSHFIYDVENDTVHRVKEEGNSLQLSDPVESVFAEWLPDDHLALTNYVSVDIKEPWLMTSR